MWQKQTDGCVDWNASQGHVEVPGVTMDASLDGVKIDVCFCSEELCNSECTLHGGPK